MSDSATATLQKPKKLRSPSFPAIDLATAIKRAEAFYDKEKRNSAPLRIAAVHWGSNEKSSAALQAAAALKSFGLLSEAEGADRRLQLTDLGLRIILDKREASPEREQLIKKAALMPAIHQALWTKYGANLPSDGNLSHELVFERRFNENSVGDFIREYKATIAYAKLTASDSLSVEDSGTNEDENEDQVKIQVGTYVQWEPQGVMQFREPKRVREISEDGNWAFVDGSNTGMPVKEIMVMETPVASPTQPNNQAPKPRTIVHAEASMLQETFVLPEGGSIMVQWPASISPDSLEDIKDWLPILERKIKRSVKTEPKA